MLENIEPNRVMYYFEEISKIPRGSGNEKAISDYVANFAREHGLLYIQDEVNNVIVKKNRTNESSETIIIQAHMDMVCEKTKGVEHDFQKDGIKLKIDGDFIKAEGTTLGADDGIGVAYNLAILESNEIKHPNLEAVFTVDEEEGMTGANGLDMSKLSGSMLINIDSEEEGIITVGCAGGARININITADKTNLENIQDFQRYEILVKGLHGGHSGIDIDKNRGNAIRILVELLKNFEEFEEDMYIYSLEGGMKVNAIPREASAKILVNTKILMKFLGLYNSYESEILKKYIDNESELKIELNKISVDEACDVYTKETSDKIINVINNIIDGVYTMSSDVEGLVESSSNLGVLKCEENKIELSILPRSSKVEKLEEIIKQITSIMSEQIDAKIEVTSRYPAWDYEVNSKIRDVAVQSYKELTGVEPIINIIHAGLECAVFKQNNGKIDVISIGPNLYDPHTPNERISISSTQKTWNYLLKIIEKI
ncbi:MAG: hypothetical protein A2Y22_02225 [Clostridiales bacterium GWD2_32_59]|nr:MAG: hypothetical protein A2Y22_02225 [Clostridiales bacterium GWD2_32_59]